MQLIVYKIHQNINSVNYENNEARETREHDLARANGTCKQCLEKEKLERELDKPF